ncbi:hypothetical protein [Nocardia huaxiensis]|uniref:Putative mannosyltransferase YkcA/B-like C-terminal domain-containing protein n=1 Tax=Nocardia huaxiensis TaxID=2755382 RepID=A0A7D6ZA02_9NOCA|nr:hypothetical protein H0264_37400 [Nocardia huaxiensis]
MISLGLVDDRKIDLMASKPSDRVNAMLLANGDNYTWVAATRKRQQRSRIPAGHPTSGHADWRLQRHRPLTNFGPVQKYVQEGKIHYFIGGGQGMQRPGSTETLESTLITQWVKEHYTAQRVDGITLYDLTQLKS